jgi:hypothetical protein
VQPCEKISVHVSVWPASGSSTTHFRVSFKTLQATGVIGGRHDLYRLTASDAGRGNCVSSTYAIAPPTPAGATVHVTLAPTAHERWCAGTFRGQVWNVVIPPCPVGRACPAILPLPQMVGRFTFRVRPG